jgi:hypothetical protein
MVLVYIRCAPHAGRLNERFSAHKVEQASTAFMGFDVLSNLGVVSLFREISGVLSS